MPGYSYPPDAGGGGGGGGAVVPAMRDVLGGVMTTRDPLVQARTTDLSRRRKWNEGTADEFGSVIGNGNTGWGAGLAGDVGVFVPDPDGILSNFGQSGAPGIGKPTGIQAIAFSAVWGQRRHFFYQSATIKLLDLADYIFWCSLGTTPPNTVGMPTDEYPVGADYVGIRFSSGVDGGEFTLRAKPAGSPASTFTPTGIVVAPGTLYVLELFGSPANIACRINGGPIITHAATLPLDTVGLFHGARAVGVSKVAANKRTGVYSVFYEQD